MVQETPARFKIYEQIHITFRPRLSARHQAKHPYIACSVLGSNAKDIFTFGF